MEIRVTSNCNTNNALHSNSSMLPIDHSTPNLRSNCVSSPTLLSPSQGSSSHTGHGSSMGNPLFPANRMLSKNSNGTIAMTSCPTNDSELQLYRVLQRSNLLSYYDTFICQGGDDVQQLCDAGEEEFLEIMALVGMASKPLHVRRLQKALQEWVSNPAMFQAALVPTFPSSGDRPTGGLQPPNPTSSTGSSSSSSSSGSTASSTSSSAAAVAAAAAAVAAVAATTFHGLAPPSVLPLAPPPPSANINNLNNNSSSGFPLVNPSNLCNNNNSSSNGNRSVFPGNEQLDVKSINPVNLSSSSISSSPLNIGSMALQQQQQPNVTVMSSMGSLGVISSSSGTNQHQNHHHHHQQHQQQQQQQSSVHPSSHHHVTSSSSSSSASSSGSSSLSVSLSIHPKSSSTPTNGSVGITALSNHSSSHSGPPSPSSKDNSITITSNGNIQCPPNNLTSITSQNQARLITNEYGQPASPISLTPVLVDNQIIRLAEAAENLVKSLPPMDAKLATNKKRISKELEVVINMAEDDPKRMDEIRKYAAIYGRFDCKRKPEKPLTLHEVSVNEAAAQICKHIPALLTRRDELFPLARQVVRNSGYQYSKGHSRSQFYPKILDGSGYNNNVDSMIIEGNGSSSGKRRRLSENDSNYEVKLQCTEEEKSRRQGRLENIIDQLKTFECQQKDLKSQLQQAHDLQNLSHINQVQIELENISSQQMQLINEQSEINKQLKKWEKFQSGINNNRGLNRSLSDEKVDTDDTDSQFSVYSNELSPCMSQPGQPDESPVHESSQNSDNFNRILPTNKTGNHLVSNQLTRQLAHETLLDEGLRLVKEFTDVHIKDCDLSNRIKETIIINNNHHHLDSKDSNNNINNHNDHNSNDEINNHSSHSNGSSNDNGIDLRVKQIENGSPKSTSIQSTNWSHN
ncbi:NAB transcription cofactor mab-10-like isoform X2 [Panonychus citri]|uniref:NAB transcription cofactor mab-10-like isoform X2 n=1 Tax=Panonychus citri TaxID=50023 RepID=UPI002307FF49|nr:NAB transcription cofactor mab-10-like isoform X2 [Panonychus citri]